ncbi:hypothetical protein Tco_0698420 [Tanacetum coccineum]
MNLEVTDTSSQPNPEQMVEEFTTTAYLNVQENLKLPTEGKVRLEEPTSFAGTLSSLQNLNKELSFTDQFLDTSSIPLMTTPVMDITDPQIASTTIQTPLQTSTTTTTVTTTTTTTSLPLPPPPQPQQGSSDPIIIQRIVELEQHMADLASKAMEERIHLWETQDLPGMIREQMMEYMRPAPLRARFKDLPTSDMKEILLQRMLEENYDKGHEDHKMAYEALQTSILRDEREQFDADKAEKLKKMKGKQDSPKTPPESPPPPPLSSASRAFGTTRASDFAQNPLPPPPHPTTHRDDQSQGSTAPGSSKIAASTEYTAWTTTISRLKPDASSVPEDVFMYEESDFEAQDMVSDDEDIGSRHIPKVPQNQAWFKPLSEEERTATPEPAWSISSSSLPVPINNWASALASSYESPPENSLLSQTDIMSANHSHWVVLQVKSRFRQNSSLKKDLEYLRHKGDRLALSITKMKAASYPDAGLEQMVPDQMWAKEEYMYDISASYGISHCVVSIDVFSIYVYDYMNKIVLQRADNQEYTIAESHFKDLYLSDFEDLYLLNLQGHLNHLPPRDRKILSSAVNLWIRNLVIRKQVEDFQLGIESYQTQLNLTKPRWEATGLEFMHDYKILDSSRAILFRDKYGMQMLMRFNKIHKFSDGTLQQIDEALDYRVKEFKVNKNNPALNTKFWTTNDVIKCKQFMFAIQKQLKLRRIFRNLESFVGG